MLSSVRFFLDYATARLVDVTDFLSNLIGKSKNVIEMTSDDQATKSLTTFGPWGSIFSWAVGLSITCFASLILFIVWAAYAQLDEIARGEGAVIPQGRIQVAQNLEGGIVSEIFAREGSLVQQNEILIRLENVLAETTLKDAEGQRNSLQAAIVRLEAELSGKPLNFPEIGIESSFQRRATEIDDQIKLYRQRQIFVAEQRSVLESQLSQKRQELNEAKAKTASFRETLSISRKQKSIAEPLARSGVYPQVELLRIEREIAAIEGDLRATELAIPRIEEAAKEIEIRLKGILSSFQSQVAEELSKKRNELNSIEQSVLAGKDRILRTEVRSPVRGVIKTLRYTTVGSVIKPGDVILEIVPADDKLQIETKVKPADIAFIAPGQTAHVRLTAFDSSIYGFIVGRVENVGADTFKEENGEPFYKVIVSTTDNSLKFGSRELAIVPGMVAQTDILTGRKSVLYYLLKPLIKMRERAFTER